MNHKSAMIWVGLLSRRAFWLYAILIVASVQLIDFNKIDQGLKLRVLTYLMPASFDYIVELINTEKPAEPQKLKPYKYFYERMVEYLPERADAHDFLAFCYARLGNKGKALALWHKARDIEPGYFGTNFNLGKAYFEQEDYEMSSRYLEAAVRSDAQSSYQLIVFPKSLYGLTIQRAPEGSIDALARIKEAYAQDLEYLILSRYHLNDNSGMYKYAVLGIKSKFGHKDVFYFYAGLAAYRSGNYAQAAEYFKVSLDISPWRAEPLLGYVNALIKLNKFTQAQRVLSALSGKAPSLDFVASQWNQFKPNALLGRLEYAPF